MSAPLSWIVGFGRFWYHFIIGDDWTMAVAVAVGLVVTAVLNARGILAWWLIPLIVIAMLGISIRRASSH
ncbi:MAG: hypothetical protein PVSMB9_10560 [Candidatus Dormibacteria bacterium]